MNEGGGAMHCKCGDDSGFNLDDEQIKNPQANILNEHVIDGIA